MKGILLDSKIPLEQVSRGKVRDVYRIGDKSGKLLIVTTDRISAFDVVMKTHVERGELLNAISKFWFNRHSGYCNNHLFPKQETEMWKLFGAEHQIYSCRCMVVRELAMLPFEFIVRSHLTGTAYTEYLKSGTVSGVPVAKDLKQFDQIPGDPIFCVTTKEKHGHDREVRFADVCDKLGVELASQVRDVSLELFKRSQQICKKTNIPNYPNAVLTLADAKLEFGLWNGQLMWADEAFTPDCSRYWIRDGERIDHLSKQILRDHLSEQKSIGAWNGRKAIALHPNLCRKIERKYQFLHDLLLYHLAGNQI
ncbi:phosphoribosylaminoimidazolesuccinocarboxamide synthase [Candidatus Berkelbacteria bacterium]|nr:phosphoribosylaminoimidazolesuccinocarboxamide synthase [Candidatus Berkelbacteria bacterium]